MSNKKRPKRPKRAKKSARRPRARAKPLRIVDAVSRGPGRPSPYVAEYAHLAEQMVKLGATDMDLAKAFGVSRETIYAWMRLHAEFSDAIRGAKQLPDERVERSLFARAVGYECEATKIVQNGSEVIAVNYVEHYPPDTAAAFIWLKNRKPMEWRDRREIANETPDSRSERELTDEELFSRLERLEYLREQEAKAIMLLPAPEKTPAKK